MIPARQVNSQSVMDKAGSTFLPEETEPAGRTLEERPADFTMVTLGTHEFMTRGHCRKNYYFSAFFLVAFFLVDRLAFFLVAFFLVDRLAFFLAFFLVAFLVAFFLVDRLAFFLVAFFLADRLAFFLVAFFFAFFFFAIGYGSFPEYAPTSGPAIPLGAHCGGMTFVVIASLIPAVLSHFQSVVCPISAANFVRKTDCGRKALALFEGGLLLPGIFHNCFLTQIEPISISPRQVESDQFRIPVQIPLADNQRGGATSVKPATANSRLRVFVRRGLLVGYPLVQCRQLFVAIVFTVTDWTLEKTGK